LLLTFSLSFVVGASIIDELMLSLSSSITDSLSGSAASPASLSPLLSFSSIGPEVAACISGTGV